jgi:tRNA modification GTPase
LDRMSGSNDRVVVSRLTAEGRGALGALRLTGPGALALASRAFRSHTGSSLLQTPADRLRVGRIGPGVGDEVVVVWSGDPAEIEIQCHGGPAALGWVRDSLVAEGACVELEAEPLAVFDGPRFETEAELELARAPTLRVAEVLLDQARGALREAVVAIDRDLSSDDATTAERARSTLERLLERADIGMRLVSGWCVVLAGRPNVGKSRLLNALAGYDRAIVAPTPGTTRDIVTVRTAFDGWPVELCDTAGVRRSDDAVEASGIELARASHARAELLLLLFDGSRPWTPDDDRLLGEHPASLKVRTKCDLPWVWPDRAIADHDVSAQTGEGVSELARALGRRIVSDPPRAGEAVPFREGHRAALTDVLQALDLEGVQMARGRLRQWLRWSEGDDQRSTVGGVGS